MKFYDELCEGVGCPECPFNKGEDGCLLAKRLDEIEITSESCEDAVPSVQPTDADIQKMQDIEQAMLDKAYECGKQDAMQWIPCSERLPEHGGRYLISVLDGINRRTTVAPYQPRCKAWAMNGRMAYWKVIAWLPLPEPYKGGEDE